MYMFKLKFFLLFLLLSINSLYLIAQEQKVTIDVNNVTLNALFKAIEKQTTYKFSYKNIVLDKKNDITVTVSKTDVSLVLDQVLSPRNLDFRIVSPRMIVISKKVKNHNNKKSKITGVIKDESGEPVIGANVVVIGTSIGTISDLDGKFVIDAPLDSRLNVSFIGFESKNIAIKGKKFLNILLKEDSKTLDEVVVIGFGSVKKSNLTTSVSKINSEALEERPFTNLSEALGGQLSGVQSKVSSGVPGEDLQITVRGASSLNSATPPLYVVDGIITESINDINPGDVASIQVLKDAAATSIYGARGSSGVILVETKQAKKGKPVVSFDAYYGLQQADLLPPIMDSKEWLAYNVYVINATYLNKNSSNTMSTPNKLRPTANQIPEQWLVNPDSDVADWRLKSDIPMTDWVGSMLRTAPVQSYQVSASGRGDIGNIFFSGAYLNQEGIVKNTGYDRINFRLNGTLNINKNIQVGVSFAPSMAKQDRGEVEGKDQGLFKAMILSPMMSMESGTKEYGFDPLYNYEANPYIRLMSVVDKKEDTRFNSSAWFQYKFLKMFTFKSTYSNNFRSTVYEYFIPGNVVPPNKPGGSISQGNSYSETYKNWAWQNVLTFDKKIRKHDLNLMIGQSVDDVHTYRATVAATGFPLEIVPTLNVASTPTKAQTIRRIVRTSSLFSRFSYNYGEKYLFSASVRRDGSSRFGPGNRWGIFPSLSGGWKINEEKFMKKIDWLSLLKIRASWGRAGNDRIGFNDYLSTMTVSSTVYGGQYNTALYPNNIANPDLQWETTTSLDWGIDMSLFKNRIQFSFDYYINDVESLLYNLQIPMTSGFDKIRDNIGSIRNQGWEIDLNTKNIVTRKFKWETDITLSRNKEKVLNLGGNDNIITTNWNAYFLTEVGGPLSQFYLYRTDGLLTENDFALGPDGTYDKSRPLVPILKNQVPGNYQYVDTNGDGVITDADMTAYGDNVPDLIYGLTNRFSYKNFELSIALNGQIGGDILYMANRGSNNGNRNKNNLDSWLHSYKPVYRGGDPLPEGLGIDMSWDGKTPLAYGLGSNEANNQTVTDQRVYDASFLRIRNVTLSYKLPKRILKKMLMSDLKFYVSLENLYTFTSYIANPESNSHEPNNPLLRGVDYSTYPLSRKYTLGLNLTF